MSNNGTAILAELNGLRPLLGTGFPTPVALSPATDDLAIASESHALAVDVPTDLSEQAV